MKFSQLQSKDLKDRSYLIPELLVFQGDSPAMILKAMDTVLQNQNLKNEQFGVIKQLSYQTQAKFNDLKTRPAFRAAITAYGETELLKKLTQMRKIITDHPLTAFSYPTIGLFYGTGDPSGKLAYLFPGQGAQYIGMGGALASAFHEAEKAWKTLGEMKLSGSTIKDIVFPSESTKNKEADFQRLCSLEWANPSIAVVGESIYRMLKKMGVQPDAVASHSFGDISSLRVAGILSPEKMIQAAHYRGKLGVNCSLASSGCLLVIADTVEKIQEVMGTHRLQDVWIANYNTPSQTVITGVKDSIYKAQAAFDKEGINTRLIPVSIGPHCPLTEKMAEEFTDYLKIQDFKPATCDVYTAVFGRKVKENDPDLFKKILRIQIEKPVRFMNQIRTMYQDGIHIFIEVAPSDILTNMVHEILENKPYIAMSTDTRKGDAVLTFLNSVAELFKEGRIKNLQVLWEGYAVPRTIPDHDGQRTREAHKIKQLKKLDLEFARMERGENLRKAV